MEDFISVRFRPSLPSSNFRRLNTLRLGGRKKTSRSRFWRKLPLFKNLSRAKTIHLEKARLIWISKTY